MNLSAAGDMPTISSLNYTSNAYTSDTMNAPWMTSSNSTPLVMPSVTWASSTLAGFNQPDDDQLKAFRAMVAQRKAIERNDAHADTLSVPTQNNTTMAKRIIRVYIADTDDNIPLEKSVLYSGSEKLTDLTDQELYFEIPIQELLQKHNTYRAGLVDKKATQRLGKEVYLEPVKIRDLKMVVTTIATF